MAWGKGKTEKGQGGKLGHSNRDGWLFHDEEKVISKKQRRLDQKQLILDETSAIDDSLRKRIDLLAKILTQRDITFEIHTFDSGAAMVDIHFNTEFYCIQLSEGKFGWSKIDEETGFSTIPDSGYLEWSDFKREFDRIIQDPN